MLQIATYRPKYNFIVFIIKKKNHLFIVKVYSNEHYLIMVMKELGVGVLSYW